MVWKLDRLGRSLQHLVEMINALQARGVEFRSLTENIDTTSLGGKLTFHIFAAVAEFARDLTLERTRAGLAAARARGRRVAQAIPFPVRRRDGADAHGRSQGQTCRGHSEVQDCQGDAVQVFESCCVVFVVPTSENS